MDKKKYIKLSILLLVLSGLVFLAYYYMPNINRVVVPMQLVEVSVLPTDVDYLKSREEEQTALENAGSDSKKIDLHLSFAEKRLSESLQMKKLGRTKEHYDTFRDYTNELTYASSYMTKTEDIISMLNKHSKIILDYEIDLETKSNVLSIINNQLSYIAKEEKNPEKEFKLYTSILQKQIEIMNKLIDDKVAENDFYSFARLYSQRQQNIKFLVVDNSQNTAFIGKIKDEIGSQSNQLEKLIAKAPTDGIKQSLTMLLNENKMMFAPLDA